MGEGGELADRRLGGKALDAEVAAGARAGSRPRRRDFASARSLVAQVRAVRGAHLDQRGAALLQDVGNAERSRRSPPARRATPPPCGPRPAPGARAAPTAAPLLTTSAASAPVRRREPALDPGAAVAATCRCPGPARGWNSRAPPRARRGARATASGARPRFVWSTTPVAFRTRRKWGRRSDAARAAARLARASIGAGAPLARTRERSSASSERTASTTRDRGRSRSGSTKAGWLSTDSTAGSARRFRDADFMGRAILAQIGMEGQDPRSTSLGKYPLAFRPLEGDNCSTSYFICSWVAVRSLSPPSFRRLCNFGNPDNLRNASR